MKRKSSKKTRTQKNYRVKQENRRRREEHLVDCLHLPKDVVMGAELATLFGNRKLQIRNFKKLLLCKEGEISLLAGRHKIRVTGRCLTLAYFAAEEVLITGCIESICYEE